MIASIQQELAGGKTLNAFEQAALYGQAHDLARERIAATRAG